MRALTPCLKCGKMEKERKNGIMLFRCVRFDEAFKHVTAYRMTGPPEGCPFAKDHAGWFTPKHPVRSMEMVEAIGSVT